MLFEAHVKYLLGLFLIIGLIGLTSWSSFAQDAKPSVLPSPQEQTSKAPDESKPHSLERLFGRDPSVANTFILAAATLIAAIVGGLIAARATRKTTMEGVDSAFR